MKCAGDVCKCTIFYLITNSSVQGWLKYKYKLFLPNRKTNCSVPGWLKSEKFLPVIRLLYTYIIYYNYYIIFYELRLFVIMVLPGFDTEIMGLLPEGLKMEGIKYIYINIFNTKYNTKLLSVKTNKLLAYVSWMEECLPDKKKPFMLIVVLRFFSAALKTNLNRYKFELLLHFQGSS